MRDFQCCKFRDSVVIWFYRLGENMCGRAEESQKTECFIYTLWITKNNQNIPEMCNLVIAVFTVFHLSTFNVIH